ncbi:Exodeoxyribonuclease 7 large subunit [Slackia heliotrinireducens]|uniref:Exodeoxyribonuclease 7 large subunit n=1 Tax=Slackia heliotrinireducens (strain ATCC 29202 / DSM 20476 / NCTC 11029 / RHS 1) TaxID=471855 RepID=C7N5R1_SLAHD|nr:exodeoxyribonuclease VII large subunit [Slackia heliotrinireducens]ACV22246.1 exodeoxyribonuclease VII, large subunit [Slackia heliotrinireducens DSM 20476]VEH00393.1 Exodeoxyribonuclease 7 large subunit [Slackia heliotrinireducens]
MAYRKAPHTGASTGYLPNLTSSAGDSRADEPQAADGKRPLTVSEAMNLAKGALEHITVTIVGEVSEVNVKRGYKAAYFTVKDASAALPCMMWFNRYDKTDGVTIGMKVEMTGRFTLYPKQGRMNFDVFTLKQAGEGDLRKKVADLARKLQNEGLMDPARKVPVPAFPERIGVVTSPRGDAVHDVLRTLRRRFPVATVQVAGVPVEGEHAAEYMIEGLRACYRAKVDVILLVRGGGSFENLMPFNDEALCRAIVACPIPIVTGIGHEPDTTIADMVADVRQSTPTGAALFVSPSQDMLEETFGTYAASLASGVQYAIDRAAMNVRRAEDRPLFKDPHTLFATDELTLDMTQDRLERLLAGATVPFATQVDTAAARLARSLEATTAPHRNQLDVAAGRLTRSLAGATTPFERDLEVTSARLARALPLGISRDKTAVDTLEARMRTVAGGMLDPFNHELALSAGRMHDLSPLTVLSRGYAMATDGEGHVVKNVDQVKPGDRIEVRVSDGSLDCTVDALQPAE